MAEDKDRLALPTDGNDRVLLGAVSSDDGITPVPLEVNPLTGRLLVESTGGGSSGGLTDEELRATPVPVTDAEQTSLLTSIKANTEAISALSVVIKALQQATVNPPYLDKSVNAIRNQVQSGAITSVGTVTTVTGLTNVDGYQGKMLMIGQNMSAWANTVRSRIT